MTIFLSMLRSPTLVSALMSFAAPLIVSAASPVTPEEAKRGVAAPVKTDLPAVRVVGDRFVDERGRQVLLHGLSVISKSKAENYLSWHRPEDFAKMAAWGMNCVRLGIIWDGVEPEPGKYDDKYLDGVAQRLDWAAKQGIYVFLDMHQDLYSVLYSDGAPEWATLHNDQEHVKGAVWSDSYLVSPAVQTSFDNFWSNSPASDGIGIQDHYAAAWRHVASRFKDHPAVLGYDIMNEPFEGTSVVPGQMALLQSKFALDLASRLGKDPESIPEIAAMWHTTDGRAAITKELNDLELYEAFVDAQAEHNRTFERTKLQPMYERVAAAIRDVDSQHALILETSYHCNTGIYSAVEPVKDANGQRDANQAFAPHAYDIVVDTPQLAEGNNDRIKLILKRHQETAHRLKMPMIIGEWGAFGESAEPGVVSSAEAIQREFEQMLCSDIYWDYGSKIAEQVYFDTLNRSIPSRVAGHLLKYECEAKSGEFSCSWQETDNVDGPSIIYLTETTVTDRKILVDGKETGFDISPAAPGNKDVYVTIPPVGTEMRRQIVVR